MPTPFEDLNKLYKAAAADRDRLREHVALLRAALEAILDDASPCTTACNSMVSDSILEEAREGLEKTAP